MRHGPSNIRQFASGTRDLVGLGELANAEIAPPETSTVIWRDEWTGSNRVGQNRGATDRERFQCAPAFGENEVVAGQQRLGPRNSGGSCSHDIHRDLRILASRGDDPRVAIGGGGVAQHQGATRPIRER